MAETRETGPSELGRVLYDERRRTATLQRMLSRKTGISQPNISAYERGHMTPSWQVFVRRLAAMDRRPVLPTEPLHPAPGTFRPPASLEEVIPEILSMIGDRPYRLEAEAAAHVLGDDTRLPRALRTGGADGGHPAAPGQQLNSHSHSTVTPTRWCRAACW